MPQAVSGPLALRHRPFNEHKDIKLEHGNNRFCLNCHHPTNRNAFVDYDGSEIAQADVVMLCAKCHGTTYRDWQAGVHGRPMAIWNATWATKPSSAAFNATIRISPKFKAMKPLPPLRYPAARRASKRQRLAASWSARAAHRRHPSASEPESRPRGASRPNLHTP